MKNLLFLVPVDPQPHYIESSGRWCWPLPPQACFPGCCTEVVTASREWWEYAPSEAKPHPHAEGVRLRDDLWYWAVPGTELNATPGATLTGEPSIPSEGSRPRELLVRALKLMSNFHETFSHDSDDPELRPYTTPPAFQVFVDEHARLLYEEHHLPGETSPRQQEAFRIINAATYYVPRPRQLHAEMVAWIKGASTQEASPEEPSQKLIVNPATHAILREHFGITDEVEVMERLPEKASGEQL